MYFVIENIISIGIQLEITIIFQAQPYFIVSQIIYYYQSSASVCQLAIKIFQNLIHIIFKNKFIFNIHRIPVDINLLSLLLIYLQNPQN